jgi:hypothetical protein
MAGFIMMGVLIALCWAAEEIYRKGRDDEAKRSK